MSAEAGRRPPRVADGTTGRSSTPRAAATVRAHRQLTDDEQRLRGAILEHLRRCGFEVGADGRLCIPNAGRGQHTGGEAYRMVQRAAKSAQMARRARTVLSGRAYEAARMHCPDGSSIDPGRIRLELRVLPRAGDGNNGGGTRQTAALSEMFHWWNTVWWSMPYQPSYGRRIRYFLWDVQHDAPFGLVVLQSPILRMGARDRHLGIGRENAERVVNMSMSAQRVGALPPYNELIGGKMVALSVVCNEVREEYAARYGGSRAVMSGRMVRPEMLFATTTAAFGKSSMYDRLTYRGRPACTMAGWTRGYGTFHLPDEVVEGLYGMLERRGVRASTTYGGGPSAKVRLCRDALRILGLGGLQVHGLRRAVYVFEAAANVREVVARDAEPVWHDMPLTGAEEWWMRRWCTGRAERRDAWRRFKADGFFDGVHREVEAAKAEWGCSGEGQKNGGGGGAGK